MSISLMAIMAKPLSNFGNHQTLFDIDKGVPVPCYASLDIQSNSQYGFGRVTNRCELNITVTINADIVPDATWAMEWISEVFSNNESMFSTKYKRSLFIASNSTRTTGYAIYGAFIKSYSNSYDFNNTIELEIGCDHYSDDISMDVYFKSVRRDIQLNQLFDNL